LISARFESALWTEGVTPLNEDDLSMNGAKGALSWQLVQKFAQLGRRFELWHRIESLERAGEGVRQAPHRSRRELRVFRLEIEAVNLGQQASWRFQLAVDERRVQDQPCGIVGDLRLPPQFNLALQGLEIPLDSVHAYRERINQVEALGVLGQDGSEHTWDNVS
jgi:hypothetical protein